MRQNLICNFRSPNEELHQEWLDFKEIVKSKGLTVCRVTLSLIQAFNESVRTGEMATTQLHTATSMITINQFNVFNYQPQSRARRLPKLQATEQFKHYSRTLTIRAFESYILDKARTLPHTFSVLDFREIPPNRFRKLILRLRGQGRIERIEPRTNPRFYRIKGVSEQYSKTLVFQRLSCLCDKVIEPRAREGIFERVNPQYVAEE